MENEKWQMIIEEGDYVEVNWEHIESIRGTVLYTPGGEGDCFHIKDDKGKLHYVQHFGLITKVRSKTC